MDEKHVPVSDVNILNITKGSHAHSDGQGRFSITDVSIGDTLRLTHVGYKDRDHIISGTDKPLLIILEYRPIRLNEVVVGGRSDALSLIPNIDVQITPVNSSQDILRKIPGLFIGQHAGGGKAEQIFLRGFDIDHGTDIQITVDGLPVNMVSHAHGQGYSDLHFIIPETIDKVDFGKGPYYGSKGNFTTAGYTNFMTRRKLNHNTIKLEAGQFGTQRLLGMFNLFKTDNHNSYVATEYLVSDGPFESPQNLHRINVFGKYTGSFSSSDKVGLTFSHFTSAWDASGQIPQRAVDAGEISRFGAIDDTEGGNTRRTNVMLNYDKYIHRQAFLKNSIYYSAYDFDLFSNFTFFLDNPVNGDQIRQRENRSIYGMNSEFARSFSSDHLKTDLQIGVSLRNDQSMQNELSKTANRKETLEFLQLGNINETNIGTYVNVILNFGKWTMTPALRLDYFDFQYQNALSNTYENLTRNRTVISPKLNLFYNYRDDFQLYLKTGKGFHSNDTRVVLSETGREILPAAYGFDAGFTWKPAQQIMVNTAYWYLFLEQEFVYVGDAGIVEPSGKTKRQGVDLSVRHQPAAWLYWNLDATYTKARALETEIGQDFIPLAPDLTLSSGLNVMNVNGFYGGAQLRYLKNRPANEDNSIVALGYAVVDLNAGRNWKNLHIGFQVQNLMNTDWNETQFATLSRLRNEPEPVEEIHFTPGTPFFFRAILEFSF